MPDRTLSNIPAATQAPDAWYQAILQQWDTAQEIGHFPNFSTSSHWSFAKARLSTFRSLDEWLVIFEVLTYYNGLSDFEVGVYAYGNKLQRVGIQNPHAGMPSVGFVDNIKQLLGLNARSVVQEKEFLTELQRHGLRTPSGAVATSILGQPSTEDDWCPDPLDFEVMLQGTRQRFTLTLDDYVEAGIDLNEALSGDMCLDRIIHVLRVLSSRLPATQLFFPERLLLEYVGRPTTLPLFLQLYEWCHPGDQRIAKPSDSLCLRSLAKALAHNQPDLYECSKETINTHWSQWPQFAF
jgi:hypothetical protein